MHTVVAHAESLGPGGVVWELLHCYIVSIIHLREPACANRLACAIRLGHPWQAPYECAFA